MRMIFVGIAALLLGATPTLAAAQAQPGTRVLAVPAGNAWQHARTQMILPPQVAGLARTSIGDFGDDEMDVVAEYRGAEGVLATIYLFRTAIPDVALWFDRAAAMISLQPVYGLNGAALPAPTAFARPGAAAASGLRTATDLTAARSRRSTGVAVAPLGDHLLKIRISSDRLDRAGLDALLTRLIEGLRWPAPPADEAAAIPVQPCTAPLRLRSARVLRPDMGETLMDALIGSMGPVAPQKTAPAIYCREPGATAEYGVYRPDGSRSAYVIALNDAGIALSLSPATDLGALSGGGRARSRVSMVLLERASTHVYSSFNRLPPPAQAVAVAGAGRGPGISVSVDPPRD